MPSKKRKAQVFLVLFSMSLSNAYAFSFSSWYAAKTWHPIVTLGAGVASSSDVGESQNFPIHNPVTDEFYNYSANQSNRSAGLFEGFLGAEWNVYPNWLVQAGLDYNQTTSLQAKGTFVQGADAGSADTYSYQYYVASKQLLVAGKLLYSLKERYRPYLLAGLGATFNDAYHYSTNVPPFLTFTRQYANNTTTSFSYAIGAGIDVDITCYLRAGLGYRFTDLGQAQLGNAIIDTTSVSGTLSQSHLYTNELLAQLTWIFN